MRVPGVTHALAFDLGNAVIEARVPDQSGNCAPVGYAVECALKSCVLARMIHTG
jgi:hypothetical protein